jgi:hypothetical protein
MCELMGFPDAWEFERKWAERARVAVLYGGPSVTSQHLDRKEA